MNTIGSKTSTVSKLGPESSLKRIAWAYGTAKKGSDEEIQACKLLLLKAKQLLDDPSAVLAYVENRCATTSNEVSDG